MSMHLTTWGEFKVQEPSKDRAIRAAEKFREEEDLSTRNSIRDTEYLELARDPEKNDKKLSAMVEAAARKAWYDSPKLYHGTAKFGFTVPRGIIFATDSKETAE